MQDKHLTLETDRRNIKRPIQDPRHALREKDTAMDSIYAISNTDTKSSRQSKTEARECQTQGYKLWWEVTEYS